MADWLVQTAMNYYFIPATAGDWGASASDVNGWQIARSGFEGMIPWKTPGGRLGRAALTATGDVAVNYLNDMDGYSTEQAVQDFAVGFIGDLAGGGFGELVYKYGAKNVAGGLKKIGFDADQIRGLTGIDLLSKSHRNAISGLEGQIKSHQQKLKDYIAIPDAFDNKGFLKNANPELRENHQLQNTMSTKPD